MLMARAGDDLYVHGSAGSRAIRTLGRGVPRRGGSARSLPGVHRQARSGRWSDVRRPSLKELRASAIVSMPIEEASAKARTGPPHGDPLDEDLDTWEGVIPMVTRFGEPEPAPGLSEGVGLAPSVRTLLSHRPDGRGGDTGS